MGSIYKQKGSNNYWIKYYRNGKPMRESTGTDKLSEAKRQLALKEGDIAKGVPVTPRMGRVLIDELIEDLNNEYKANERVTCQDVERRCRLHLLPFFSGRKAAGITTADVNRYIVSRQAEKASNA